MPVSALDSLLVLHRLEKDDFLCTCHIIIITEHGRERKNGTGEGEQRTQAHTSSGSFFIQYLVTARQDAVEGASS
eukprot:1151898-Pelagomonas_calceolata.AAC.2